MTDQQLLERIVTSTYAATWVSILTGEPVKQERWSHPGVRLILEAPAYEHDIALRLAAADS